MISVSSDDPISKLHLLIQECGKISGNLARQQKFRELGQDIKPLLQSIYDPYQKFHVTSNNMLKFKRSHNYKTQASPQTASLSLVQLLHRLSHGDVSGHEALRLCLDFIYERPAVYRETLLKALDKDLQIRVGVKMVNKAFPLLVPTFSCALSHPMEKHLKYFNAHKDEWHYSRKLDGCRCVVVCKGKKATAYSRSGHEYPRHIQGLSSILDRLGSIEGAVDGEMVVVDDEGKEYFSLANSLMNPHAKEQRSKNNMQLQPHQRLCFMVFDWIPLQTFKQGYGGPTWSQRQKVMKQELPFDGRTLVPLEQFSASEADSLWEKAVSLGWEGLILRLDKPYEGKKSRNMLKKKMMHDDEFVIEDATVSQQMAPGSTESQTALEHVGIKYKGCRVWVGSGFTWKEKVKYGKDMSQVMGAHVTVKHYGESRDKQGNYSLRHPTVKKFWGHKGRTH